MVKLRTPSQRGREEPGWRGGGGVGGRGGEGGGEGCRWLRAFWGTRRPRVSDKITNPVPNNYTSIKNDFETWHMHRPDLHVTEHCC